MTKTFTVNVVDETGILDVMTLTVVGWVSNVSDEAGITDVSASFKNNLFYIAVAYNGKSADVVLLDYVYHKTFQTLLVSIKSTGSINLHFI